MVAQLRRLPFPALLLAVALAFAAAGASVLDDYGVSNDENVQRGIAIANADYIAGDREALPENQNRFYGVSFELPLLMAERILRLQDSRDIFLLRHYLTHLLFIAGGFACGLLAWRMFNNRWAALAAMLLFLLHPRLYAHSFFNSKDIPFLAMFVIALYLTHRAFRRNTIAAFLLCGVGVGLAANLRVFGLMLFPAILAMLALDWRQASGGAGRRKVLSCAGIFAASVLITMYVAHPWYWENPLRLFDNLQASSQHPLIVENLFMGQTSLSDAAPPHYIPVWFLITAPPVALALGIVGIISVCRPAFRAPQCMLYDGELRFRILLLACLILPIVAAIVLQANIYNGWRQMYFLWAPFCLLAAAGVMPLSIWAQSGGRGAARAWRRVRIANPGLAVAYGAAAAGLGSLLYAIVSLHPHQQVYFNPLVDLGASGNPHEYFDLDYWGASYLQGLEYLRESYPNTILRVKDSGHISRNLGIMPAAEREYIELVDVWNADFHLGIDRALRARSMPTEPAIYTRQAYDSTFLTVVAPRLVWGGGLRPDAADYRAAYQAVVAANNPAAQSDFDVYIGDNAMGDAALYYVKDDCQPADTAARFSLHFIPVDRDDLPAPRQERGFDNRNFSFSWQGGYFDGKCITQAPLPDYPIARIRTGQSDAGERVWHAEFPVNP